MTPRQKSGDPEELSQQPRSQDPTRDASPEPIDASKQPQRTQEQADGDPRSGEPGTTDPDQRESSRPPPLGPTGVFERTDLTGRWGTLPPKDAEDLQRRNAEEFPQRYRTWMELYFRRVNQLESRAR